MEGEGDGTADGGVISASLSEQNLKGLSGSLSEGDNRNVDPQIVQSDLIDDNGDSKPEEISLELQTNQNWENVSERISHNQSARLSTDNVSKLSPSSNANSEGSEREILLEPDYESTSLSESRALSTETPEDEPVREAVLNEESSSFTEAALGPSEEREDISDEELELYSGGNSEDIQPEALADRNMENRVVGSAYNLHNPYMVPERTTEATLPAIGSRGVSYDDSDIQQSPYSDDKEIIDLKFEDAAGKSDTGSPDDDLNPQSKAAIEDLENVSDDELPETALTNDPTEESTFKLIDGGERVSSSEDEGPDSTCAVLQQILPPEDKMNSLEGIEFSYGNINLCDRAFKTDEISTSQLNLESPGSLSLPLAPLEAEPISDEEELGHGEASPLDVEDGEAGEIHSPVNITSPASFPEQSAALLGEVEPISADENSDTDGELPSGDEDNLPEKENGVLNCNTNFLESIDSEEEGDLEPVLSLKQPLSDNRHSSLVSSDPFAKQKTREYMETISGEDDSRSAGGHHLKRLESSVKAADESHTNTSPIGKDAETEKRQISSNFNEHQEELDYEENEGEDGEGKSEEAVKPPQKKEVKEAGEHEEDGASDKDEGELSDDDCEEGEIKEPGSKKPFIKPMCRFFQRGNCTWGINCRFLHPGINDKGNYQMIEIPGFKPVGVRSRLGAPGTWPEQTEEQIELPPPPVPDVPPVETAWERGLRIAKEQRKKASERKELESDFEDKRLNLSVDEERELNKENERMPKIIPKDPYYDQLEEDNYYQISRNPWQTGHYENFEVRYNTENSFSPPYRDKPPMMPPPRFSHPYSPPIDKFGRDRIERREPFRPEVPPALNEYPSPLKRPDEWTDPWRRSKSPQNQKRKIRSRSRGKRARRSVSDSSNSSRSSSGSSSGSSRSSRTFNSSTGSSSRSRSPEPAPPGVERHDRYMSPSREQPRSTVSVRGSGGYGYDQGNRRMKRNYDHNRGASNYNQRGGNRGNSGGFYNNNSNNNNYGGGMSGGPVGGNYPERDVRDRARDDRINRNRGRSPPDRPLPYVRPRPKSASSRSSSSRSRSRSRGRATSSRSRSRSSSASSRSSSSTSSSAGSADSEHLYRDLGSPSKNPRGPSAPKRKRTNSHKDHPSGKSPQLPGQQAPQRRQGPPASQMPINLDHIPHPRDPKPPLPPVPTGRPESKYASRNAPQAPVKAKDPLKVVGQKSNIKLTLLPKQQQSSFGTRPNPLDSPPAHKRRLSDHDTSPVSLPPAKRLNLPVPPQSTSLRLAIEKAAKIQIRQEKGKSPPPALIPQSLPPSSLSANVPRARAVVSPQKQPISVKSRAPEPAVAKIVPKPPSANSPPVPAAGTKVKKSMSSRREELLKQLKAVEDAIARKKSKLQ